MSYDLDFMLQFTITININIKGHVQQNNLIHLKKLFLTTNAQNYNYFYIFRTKDGFDYV